MKHSWLCCLCACAVDGRGPDTGATDATTPDAASADAGIVDAAVSEPRVALRQETGAAFVDPEEGPNWLRLVLAFDDPGPEVSAARDPSRWRISVDGDPIALDGAQSFLFPRIDAIDRTATVVWRVPVESGGVAIIEAPGQRFELPIDPPRSILAALSVQPIVVRKSDGSGGPARTTTEIGSDMRRFVPYFARRCQLELEVLSPIEIRVDGFESLMKYDFIELDDPVSVGIVRDAVGEVPGTFISLRLEQLYQLSDTQLGTDRSTVRAFVFTQHRTTEEANALVPTLFHYEQAMSLWNASPFYPRLPTYAHDPELPLLDESVDPPRIAQELVELEGDRAARVWGLYFGSDHLEAFGHELGHALGLPHPSDSSVIDAIDGDNFMSATDECTPDCGFVVTPHQCEIMLSGLTGYAVPR